MSTEEEPLHGVRWMLTLYLLVHYGTGLLMIAGAAYAVSRVIQTQRAKLPPVTQSLLPAATPPRRRERKALRRLQRRHPQWSYHVAAPVPRRWYFVGCIPIFATAAVWAVAMPDGARFQVMVESTLGYPTSIAQVRLPASRHAALLQAWQPVIAQGARTVEMDYTIGRPPLAIQSRDVLPVQVRQQGDLLQVAFAQPMQTQRLQAALTARGALAAGAVQVHPRTFAPWRERGWTPLLAPAPAGRPTPR